MSMALSRKMKNVHAHDDDSDEELPRRRKKEVNPHDARWLVGEGGEQGYYDDAGAWVTTGWHDAEGYWFEACGEFDARGRWNGTGKFDVWDPEGDWYETGYFDENEEWVVEDAFYDEDGDALELEKELRRNLPGGVHSYAPEWKPPAPKKTAAEWNAEQAASGQKKLTHAEKYALERARQDPKAKPKDKGFATKKEVDGRLMRIAGPPDHVSSSVWNDQAWALLFAVACCATVFLAVYKNTLPEEVEEVTACSSNPCLNGAECVVRTGVSLEQANQVEGYSCNCADGWVGPVCQIRVARQQNVSAPAPVEEQGTVEPQLSEVHVASIVTIAFVAAVIGSVWSVLWLQLLKWPPFMNNIVKATLLSAAFFQFVFGLWLLTIKNGFGLLVILSAGFTAMLITIMQAWIPFTTVMLSTSVAIVADTPAIVLLAGGATVFQGVWILIWSYAFAGAGATADPLSVLFLVVANFWTVQVIKNVVHVSCAGTAASWYFSTNERNPTKAAFTRAMTTSFGSICMGSAAVAGLRTLRMVTPRRVQPQQNAFGAVVCGLALVLSSCLERMLLICNHLAFTQIAIYGDEYVRAAKQAFQLLQKVGLLPIANLALLQGIGWMSCTIGAGLAALVGASMVPGFELTEVFPTWAAATMSFLIGFSAVMPLTEAVDSCTTSIFICFAKNPDVLKHSHNTELYEHIMEALAYARVDDIIEDDNKGDSGSDYTEEYTDDDSDADREDSRAPRYGT